jgi:hypothetical protein
MTTATKGADMSDTRVTRAGYVVKTDLPKIVRFLDFMDYGPADGGQGSTTCPHCGSPGRYVLTFLCDDGGRYSAMRGCVKLFPTSRIAVEDQKLVERLAELRKTYGPEAKLNSWQARIREALDAFYAGEANETDTIRTIDRENAAMKAWRSKRR